MIEFRNVNKTYDTGTVAVNNANFKIEKGEFAFLVGSSGSGKSTLIKLILKEEEPTSGNIIINGKDTKNIVLVIFNEKPNTLEATLVSIERVVEGSNAMGGINVDAKTATCQHTHTKQE